MTFQGTLPIFNVGSLSYFLFRLGYVNNEKKYFDYVQDIGDDNIFIMEYKNIINSVLSLYRNNE